MSGQKEGRPWGGVHQGKRADSRYAASKTPCAGKDGGNWERGSEILSCRSCNKYVAMILVKRFVSFLFSAVRTDLLF